MKGVVFTVFLLCASTLPAAAAEPVAAEAEKPAVEIEEKIVVTAPPIVEESRYEPLAGTVVEVGARQVDHLAAQDLAAALRRVPGCELFSRLHPVGGYGGGDGRRGLVHGLAAPAARRGARHRVDGVARFAGVWTHPLLDLTGIDGVERIDVYKGPQPVLFGGMSFATIDLLPHRRQSEGIETRIGAAGGSYGTSAFTLRHAGRAGALDWTVAAGARESDGHRQGADGRTQSLLAHVGYELGAGWSAGLTLDRRLRQGERSGSGVAGTRVRRPFGLTACSGLTLTRRHGTGKQAREGVLKLHLDDGSIDWRQWDAGQRHAFFTLTDWRNYGMRLEDHFAVGDGGDLTLGFEMERYGGRSREVRPASTLSFGDFRFVITALFAGYAHTFGERGCGSSLGRGCDYNDSATSSATVGQVALRAKGRGRGVGARGRAFNSRAVCAAAFYKSYGPAIVQRSSSPNCSTTSRSVPRRLQRDRTSRRALRNER